LGKVREEIAEVTAEIESDLAFAHANEAKFIPAPETAEELGDLLFSIVNLTRHLKLDAEELLTGANDKFARRFRAVEARIKAQGKAMTDCTMEELDAAWNAVKAEGSHHTPCGNYHVRGSSLPFQSVNTSSFIDKAKIL